MDCFLHRLIKEPIDKAQSEHIPAFEDGFIIHSALAERLFGKRRERDRHNLYGLRDAQLRKRIIRMVLRFLEVFVGQRISVNDDDGMAMIERELLIKMRLRVIEMRT